jgi:hypothetical protein
MTHLPIGGWTTMLPSCGLWMSVVPAFQRSSGLAMPALTCISVPKRMSDQPSLT